MRELSDYTGVSYSTIRKLKWLPLIPEINKMFYEHFMLAIERKNGLDNGDSPILTPEVIERANADFPKGTERPGWSRYKAERDSQNKLRQLLAEYGISLRKVTELRKTDQQ